MTSYSVNYGYYYPQNFNKSDIPGRTSRICYADNDSVPPEKRGKEISDEDYKRLQEQRLGSARYLCAPSAKTVKNLTKYFDEWLEKYLSKPHRYNTDDIKDNAQTVIDLYDNYTNPSQQNNNKHDYLI